MSFFPIHAINPRIINGSLSASIIGEPINVQDFSRISTETVWSGGTGTTGSVLVEATSTDPSLTSTVWATVATVTVSGASGSNFIVNTNVSEPFCRVRWNRTGGTGGTISVNLSGKR